MFENKKNFNILIYIKIIVTVDSKKSLISPFIQKILSENENFNKLKEEDKS